MDLKLIRAGLKDGELLWKMQVEAFSDMYNKYHDTDTSPAAEPLSKILDRLKQPFTYYYFIQADGDIVGAVRVIDAKRPDKAKKISPIFVMPPYRQKGIALKAIRKAEDIHGNSNWELETVLQETGNCRLYEKAGYRKIEKTIVINDKMTLVSYKKD